MKLYRNNKSQWYLLKWHSQLEKKETIMNLTLDMQCIKKVKTVEYT